MQDLEHLEQDLPELELGQLRCLAQFKAVRRQVLDAECPAVLDGLASLLAADLWQSLGHSDVQRRKTSF